MGKFVKINNYIFERGKFLKAMIINVEKDEKIKTQNKGFFKKEKYDTIIKCGSELQVYFSDGTYYAVTSYEKNHKEVLEKILNEFYESVKE